MVQNRLAYLMAKITTLKEYGKKFWASQPRRTKFIIVATASIGVASVGTIALVRFKSLQQAKKLSYALIPVAKNTLSKSMQLRNGCFFDKPFCEDFLKLHHQQKFIFDYIYYRNLDLSFLTELRQYMTKNKGKINYLSPYLTCELYRICSVSKKKAVPLLLDNVWKL